jgi:hypothetical protein
MINLQLELAEIEAVLKHISQGAYADVAALIAKIHGQAVTQVPPVVSTPQVTAEDNVA